MIRAKKTKKETHTLVEAIDKAYELKLCSKAVHDYDLLLVNTLGIQDLAGSVQQLTNLLALVHEYLNLCYLNAVEPPELFEEDEDWPDKTVDIKKPKYDA